MQGGRRCRCYLARLLRLLTLSSVLSALPAVARLCRGRSTRLCGRVVWSSRGRLCGRGCVEGCTVSNVHVRPHVGRIVGVADGAPLPCRSHSPPWSSCCPFPLSAPLLLGSAVGVRRVPAGCRLVSWVSWFVGLHCYRPNVRTSPRIGRLRPWGPHE